MNKKYLENNICEFNPLFEIDYTQKKNIISASLFKMSNGGYKDFNKYLDGIKDMSKTARELNMEIRMFIDFTILNDKKIMTFLKQFDNVKLIFFKCNFFLIKNHHIGLF